MSSPANGALREAGFALLGAAALGIASAFGDWLWSAHLTDGALLPALGHGVVFFVLLAVVLAAPLGSARVTRTLLFGLPPLGFALAAVFYPLAALTGYLPALLVTWVAMWLGVAAVLRAAARRAEPTRSQPLRVALLAGVVAAVGSGLAFWAISGVWTQPGPAPRTFDLAQHLGRAGRWTFAYTPGILALGLARTIGAREP